MIPACGVLGRGIPRVPIPEPTITGLPEAKARRRHHPQRPRRRPPRPGGPNLRHAATNSAPWPSPTAAAPNPATSKPHGSSCPIRFQCAGCGFYRPDPSYLPAIEQHINELRADRETALAMDAAEFVTTALTAQITAFEQVLARMNRYLAAMPAHERAALEEASTVLRRARAGAPRPLLPLTVVNRTPTGAQ